MEDVKRIAVLESKVEMLSAAMHLKELEEILSSLEDSFTDDEKEEFIELWQDSNVLRTELRVGYIERPKWKAEYKRIMKSFTQLLLKIDSDIPSMKNIIPPNELFESFKRMSEEVTFDSSLPERESGKMK